MNKLPAKLLELRKENALTQRELANAIGTSEDSIYSWEKGRAEPSIDFLIKLSSFFNCSVDYLIGLSDY